MDGRIYTKAFCINVIYFWDDLEEGYKKVYEMLKFHGLFGIYMESAGDFVKKRFTKTDIFNKHSIESAQIALQNVGFRDIKVINYSGRFKRAYFIFFNKMKKVFIEY